MPDLIREATLSWTAASSPFLFEQAWQSSIPVTGQFASAFLKMIPSKNDFGGISLP
jgi:hypothetical protein